MTTAAQILDNRKSSARNSSSHGLAGSFRVLAHENQEEFDKLLAEYRQSFPAANIHEEFLVEEMAQARWRLARVRRLEAEVVRAISGDAADNPDRALAQALLDKSGDAFRTLQRYMAAAERSYYRAHKELLESHQRDSDRVWERIKAVGSGRSNGFVPNEPKSAAANSGTGITRARVEQRETPAESGAGCQPAAVCQAALCTR